MANPHVQQGQIGEGRRLAIFTFSGRLLEAVSNHGPRRMVVAECAPSRDSCSRQNPGYSLRHDILFIKTPLDGVIWC
jgi:hypothetical protein